MNEEIILINLIRDFTTTSILAPTLAFIIGVLQGIFPFIPFVILAGTNGALFGLGFGLLITFSSALVGALISFWLARKWGQRWVLKRFGGKYKSEIERFSSRYGFRTVLVTRLIPIIPSPLINILSGVSKIRFNQFGVASAIGIFPFAFIYTFGGNELLTYNDNGFIVLIVIFVLVVLYLYAKYGKSKQKI